MILGVVFGEGSFAFGACEVVSAKCPQHCALRRNPVGVRVLAGKSRRAGGLIVTIEFHPLPRSVIECTVQYMWNCATMIEVPTWAQCSTVASEATHTTME